jgi:hypothetical protein
MQLENNMSKMKNLFFDIQELLEQGYAPKSVAEKLDVPLSMVFDVEHEMNEFELQKQYEFMSYEE